MTWHVIKKAKELKRDLTSRLGPARTMVYAASSSRCLTGKLWYVVCQELGSTIHLKMSTPNSLASALGQMSTLYLHNCFSVSLWLQF